MHFAWVSLILIPVVSQARLEVKNSAGETELGILELNLRSLSEFAATSATLISLFES